MLENALSNKVPPSHRTVTNQYTKHLLTLKSQENVVIYYFSALMKHAEGLNNEEVLAKLKEHQVVHLVLDHVLLRKDDYALDFLGVAIEGYSKLAENEDFGVEWEDFFPANEQKEKFLLLDQVVLSSLVRHLTVKAEEGFLKMGFSWCKTR
jgi:hypothetical protein